MFFETLNGVLNIKLDLISTTTLASLLLILGYFLKKNISFLQKFCFPAPVIGGFIFAVSAWFFNSTNILTISLDITLRTPFMVAFFTTVGLGGSFVLVKKGGKLLIVYLVACWFVAIFQNVIGVTIAKAIGINPLLGVLAGAVSLEGGHGAAAAFGGDVETSFGIAGAQAIALASATFGLIAGSLSGGPLAKWLITKNKLEIIAQDENLESYDESVKKKTRKGKCNITFFHMYDCPYRNNDDNWILV